MNEARNQAQYCAKAVPSIYFVSDGDAIKIGFSENVARRIPSIQTGHRAELKLLATLPSMHALHEREIQERFAHLHIRGEWFRPGEDLLAFIEDCKLKSLPEPTVTPEPSPLVLLASIKPKRPEIIPLLTKASFDVGQAERHKTPEYIAYAQESLGRLATAMRG